MSGGAFNYGQFRISDIVDVIEDEIYHNGSIEEDEWGSRRGKHFNEYTIAEFKKGVELLKMAQIYAHRIDWLISADDGENTFHERLKKDLDELK
jgi:hypothetical protein